MGSAEIDLQDRYGRIAITTRDRTQLFPVFSFGLTNGNMRPSQRAWITALGRGSIGGDLSSVFGSIVAGSHFSLGDNLDVGLLVGHTRSSAKTDGDHELTPGPFSSAPMASSISVTPNSPSR